MNLTTQLDAIGRLFLIFLLVPGCLVLLLLLLFIVIL
jgi:hypothetical protein